MKYLLLLLVALTGCTAIPPTESIESTALKDRLDYYQRHDISSFRN